MRCPRLTVTCALAALLAGCAAPPPESPASQTRRQREQPAMNLCLAKRRLIEELGRESLLADTSRVNGELEPAVERGPAPPIERAYEIAAPATVLIRTADGLGSGVIVDARGLVLTNHHVIAGLLQPDLTAKVTLELAEVEPTGRVVPAGASLDGVVVKADATKDLALVRILDPPANLPVATLSPRDPRVGERVLSVGNAGIGLLWAAKVCNISRVGDLTRETSMLEAGDCSLADPTDDEKEARRKEEQCRARKKEVKERVEQAPRGLAVQTTCSLNGGDSGGPLVNAWGEVVGLNQSLRFAGGTLAFHVHLAELRAFVAEASLEPAHLVPDPFCRGGAEFKLEDFDGDGTYETAAAADHPHFDAGKMTPQGVFLIDLDQDDAADHATVERPFDADVAVLLEREDAWAYYDTDGDGTFDVLLRDKGADGSVELGYRLRKGIFERDDSLTKDATLRADDQAAVARLGAIALGLDLKRLASQRILASADIPPIPNPLRAFGTKGWVRDMDGDGKVDSVYGSSDTGMYSNVMLAPESDVLATLKDGDDASPVLEKQSLSPFFLSVERAAGTWAFYDTNRDGILDVVLFAQRHQIANDHDRMMMARADIVTHAFRLRRGQEPQPLRGPLGRQIMQADLVPGEAYDSWQRAMRMLGNEDYALPTPQSGAPGGMSESWHFEALERDRQVIALRTRIGGAALVDLDMDSKKIGVLPVGDLIGSPDLDAELGILRQVQHAWLYYDTDGDGVFDRIHFTRDATKQRVDNVLILDPHAQTITSLPPDGPLFQPELVTRSPQTAARLRVLVDSLLADDTATP